MISLGKLLDSAFEAAADLVECAVNCCVSIPASFNVCLIQFEIVVFVAGECGLIVVRNNFDCSAVCLHCSVIFR